MTREIAAKVMAGERLTRQDGERLYAIDNLLWLGKVAHQVREARYGNRVTFTVGDGGSVTTMLYGQDKTPADHLEELLRLRQAQDDGLGCVAFAPVLAPATDGSAAVTPAESLKLFAISRLILDNVPHLTCAVASHGLSVAQLSLNFGVDDLVFPGPGTAADLESTPEAAREELTRLIWDAEFTPVERDAEFVVTREYDPPVPQAQRRAEPQAVWS